MTPFQTAVVEGRKRGETPRAIAQRLGSTRNSVSVTLHKLGYRRDEDAIQRRNNAIRARRAEGVKLLAIAVEFGLSQSRVWQITK